MGPVPAGPPLVPVPTLPDASSNVLREEDEPHAPSSSAPIPTSPRKEIGFSIADS
jgi:hypothetical protein